MGAGAINVDDATFKKVVLDCPVPVLVDFWAKWCPPCRQMGPIVDELAGQFEGRARVVKLNVDLAPRTAAKYGVRSIPTFAVFWEGELISTLVGAQPKPKLVAALERVGA
ncbi:MAG: thioredoxin [Buchananella hordeovulneris]|nr:thioredoxin [Buchananella hordeovulneris]